MRQTESALQAAIDVQLSVVDKAELEAVKAIASAAYQYIIDNWPVYSYYSLANHRINISGAPVTRIEPATRVPKIGAHAGKAVAVHEAELQKLDHMTIKSKKRHIVIGNAVDYAEDVKFTPGLGNMIYLEAADFAVESYRFANLSERSGVVVNPDL